MRSVNGFAAILVSWSVCVTNVPLSATAQDTTGAGSLSGSVVDAAGDPAGFVTVCLAGTTQCVMTDERGAFRMLNVRSGEYMLEVTRPGETALPVRVAVAPVWINGSRSRCQPATASRPR